jgi:ATP/maltotriose-dependent transcriptional regulator MalT
MATGTARSGPRTRRAAPSGYPVLASKITPPVLPRWVISRSRLTDRIAAGAYQKLGVTSRAQAIQRAVDLRIL